MALLFELPRMRSWVSDVDASSFMHIIRLAVIDREDVVPRKPRLV